ncbi:MAG: hypothetical protein V4504_01180 [Patescibacteria group bacterium]
MKTILGTLLISIGIILLLIIILSLKKKDLNEENLKKIEMDED